MSEHNEKVVKKKERLEEGNYLDGIVNVNGVCGGVVCGCQLVSGGCVVAAGATHCRAAKNTSDSPFIYSLFIFG